MWWCSEWGPTVSMSAFSGCGYAALHALVCSGPGCDMEYFPRAGRLAQRQCRSSEPRPAEGDVGIENGRTAVLGGYVARCENCAHTLIACNACRNRHCPKCQRASPEGLARRAPGRVDTGPQER